MPGGSEPLYSPGTSPFGIDLAEPNGKMISSHLSENFQKSNYPLSNAAKISRRKTMRCSQCGAAIPVYKNPTPTVDIIIELEGGIVLIERKNPPLAGPCPAALLTTARASKMPLSARQKRKPAWM